MSAWRVTFKRTVWRARGSYLSSLASAGFLSAVSLFFAINLEAAEGGRLALAPLWAASVAPFLPVLSALLASGVWSDERASGRIELLLASPVRGRDLVIGKFFGVFFQVTAALAAAFVVSYLALRHYAAAALVGEPVYAFLPALAALVMQSALWCAISTTVSILFRRASAAAAVSITTLTLLPRGLWLAGQHLAVNGAIAFGELPIDAHVDDLAAGQFRVGVWLGYFLFTVASLYAGSVFLGNLRLCGRGFRALRAGRNLSVTLAFVAAILGGHAADRTFKQSVDFGLCNSGLTFSPRTLDILRTARGEMIVTALLSRKDPHFRSVARLLRGMERAANDVAGVRFKLHYVDPVWDLGEAERLIRLGAKSGSIVLENGRRREVLPIADGYGERIFANAVRRMTLPMQQRRIYWTHGHGEASFEDYGAVGMSDIARELSRDGYRHQMLDLSAATVPGDCALVVIAGPKFDFSRVELSRLDDYLKRGGRLLVMIDNAESAGFAKWLPMWGVQPMATSRAGHRTLSGTDSVLSEFSEHPIASPLKGSQVVLDQPVALKMSSAANQEKGGGADRLGFSSLVQIVDVAFAAVVERGAGAGSDTGLHPTRIVVIGDSGFVMNAKLAALANANRDFFINCVAFLSGSAGLVSGGVDGDVLVTGMDRRRRFRFALATGVALPAAVLAVLLALVYLKRRSK